MRRLGASLLTSAFLMAACTTPSSVPATTATHATTTLPVLSTTTTTAPRNPQPVGGTLRYFGYPVGSVNPLLEIGTGGDNTIGPLSQAGVYFLDYEIGEPVPDLVLELPTMDNGLLTENNDGTLTVRYEIDPEAVWSDGVPISGSDFAFTYETLLWVDTTLDDADRARRTAAGLEVALGRTPTADEVATESGLALNAVAAALDGFGQFELCGSRESMVLRDAENDPYHAIVPGSVVANDKSFEYTLESTAAYDPDALFKYVLPRHAIAGTDFLYDWHDRLWPSAGPFVLEEADWDNNRTIWVRNDRYWRTDPETGQALPYLDRIIVDRYTEEIVGSLPKTISYDHDSDPDTPARTTGRLIEFARAFDDCEDLLSLVSGAPRAIAAAGLDAADPVEVDAVFDAFFAGSQAAADALLARGLHPVQDWGADPTFPAYLELVDQGRATISIGTERNWEHLFFHLGDARFRANPDSLVEHLEFRRAIAHALDRDRIASELWSEGARSIDSIFEIFSPQDAGEGWSRYPYDPARSRELLAGLCDRLGRDCNARPPRLVYTHSGFNFRGDLGNLIAEMLGDVGIEVDVVLNINAGRPGFQYLDFENCTGYEASSIQWVGSYGFAPFTEAYFFFDPAVPPDPRSGANFYAWGTDAVSGIEDDPATPDCDESAVFGQGPSGVRDEFSRRYESLLRTAETLNATVDRTEYLALVREMEAILAEQVVIIPLYLRPTAYVLRSDILGGYGWTWGRGSADQNLWNVEYWYLKQPQPRQ